MALLQKLLTLVSNKHMADFSSTSASFSLNSAREAARFLLMSRRILIALKIITGPFLSL